MYGNSTECATISKNLRRVKKAVMKEDTRYIKCGQFGKDFEQGINYERMRRERLEKTQKAMEEHGLSAIVAFRPHNFRYITGIKGEQFTLGELLRYTIVPVEGKPIHWELGGDYGRVNEQAKEWGQDVRVSLPISPTFDSGGEEQKWEALNVCTDNIKMVLKDNGLGNGKVGLDSWAGPLVEALQNAGIDYTDAHKCLCDARYVKTEDELQCLRIACSIADACFYTLEHSIRPGIRECELWGEMAKTAFSLGTEHFIGLLNSGGRTNPYYRCEGSDKIISPGDMVISDITLAWMGYYTCFVRAFVEGGKPTSEQKALYRECYEALYKAMDVCKAGATTDIIADALPQQTWEN